MPLAYHRLRVAQARFGMAPPQLNEAQRLQVAREAERSVALESRVLATPEAETVQLESYRIDQAVAEITARYGDRVEMLQDLALSGLDESSLRESLARELRFDGVMSRLVMDLAEPEEEELQQFYEKNRQRFTRPERRRARHILITLNDDYVDNSRSVAQGRIEAIISTLGGRSDQFAELASSHSECPTAVEGGLLGDIRAATLYPELDQALFSMQEGEVSDVIESEMGLHLLYCVAITPGHTMGFDEAKPRIRSYLMAQQQRQHQQGWLHSLDK